MKLNIKIDTSVEEPEALIITPRMSEEVNKIVDYIGRLNGEPTVISDVKDDKVEILEQGEFIRAYAEGGKVFVRTEKGLYQIRLRLYELEERLDGSIFVRISNSEKVYVVENTNFQNKRKAYKK